MTVQIENAGASLKIITDGSPRFVLKNQIREIEVIKDKLIKIDIGQGTLYNVFIDQSEVTAPVSNTVDELRDKIIDMLQTNSAGLATELKQTEGNSEIVNLRNSVNEMKDKVNSLNDKLFFEPKIVDETNSNVVYRGFASPTTAIDFANWAIQKITNTKGILTYQWAGGNKNFDKIWNDRKTLTYS